jgi:hypothetical protein
MNESLLWGVSTSLCRCVKGGKAGTPNAHTMHIIYLVHASPSQPGGHTLTGVHAGCGGSTYAHNIRPFPPTSDSLAPKAVVAAFAAVAAAAAATDWERWHDVPRALAWADPGEGARAAAERELVGTGDSGRDGDTLWAPFPTSRDGVAKDQSDWASEFDACPTILSNFCP